MRRYTMSSLGRVLIARLRLIMTSVIGIAWRTLVYRNLSFHKVSKDFTAWIRAIQNATIVELSPEVDWIDDKDLIQVRRMRAQDLESQANLPESKHESEDTLHVIKLPLPIPLPYEDYPPAPQFLFVRPDEYALFKCFTQQKWCILTGNPGISKSFCFAIIWICLIKKNY